MIGRPEKIEFKTGPWGVVLTAFLVSVRAFAPGSAPMGEWSFVSWVLMLAPALYPVYLLAAMVAAWLAGVTALGAAWLAVEGYSALRRAFWKGLRRDHLER